MRNLATVVGKGTQVAENTETMLAAREIQQESLHENKLRSRGVSGLSLDENIGL